MFEIVHQKKKKGGGGGSMRKGLLPCPDDPYPAKIVTKKQLLTPNISVYARRYDSHGGDAYDPDGMHGLRLAGNLATARRKFKDARRDLLLYVPSGNKDRAENEAEDEMQVEPPTTPTLPPTQKADNDNHTTPSVRLGFYDDIEEDGDGSSSSSKMEKSNLSEAKPSKLPRSTLSAAKAKADRRFAELRAFLYSLNNDNSTSSSSVASTTMTKCGFAQSPLTETSPSSDADEGRRMDSPVLPSSKRRKVMSSETDETRD